MELYKKHKVNPLGGCLPMLIQIPFFFALYRVLMAAIELRHAPLCCGLKSDGSFNLGNTSTVTLIFIAGPNAGDCGTPNGTMQRTRNTPAVGDYGIFVEGIKNALCACFIEAIRLKCGIVLPPTVSTGIYCGSHLQIKVHFKQVMEEVLTEDFEGKPLFKYFDRIIVAMLSKQPCILSIIKPAIALSSLRHLVVMSIWIIRHPIH